jgi:hypothetical protein
MPFSLRPDGIPREPTSAEVVEITKMFPTCKDVYYQHPLLVVVVQELPKKPWPVFLADLPLAITTTYIPHSWGTMAFPSVEQRVTVQGTVARFKTPSEKTILEIYQLLNQKGACIHQIQWDGCIFFAIGNQEPGEGWKYRVPASINGFLVTYIWSQGALSEHAERKKLPKPTEIDDSDYRTSLRPGVILFSVHNDMKSTIATTSGVCVRSPSGKRFITVAAHGFSAGIGDRVYHPKASFSNAQPDDRNYIATIDRIFGDTDIALAELKPVLAYSRETFSDLALPLVQPFRQLMNLREEGGISVGDFVYMNTPVNGICTGSHMRTGWTPHWEASDVDPEQKSVVCEIATFTYWGNGNDIILDGCCGGVIWDDNYDVLGQFRRQQKNGQMLAYAPSFVPLIKCGYQLSSI